MYKIIRIVLLLFMINIQVYPQFYEYGQSPPSLEWRKIESPNFKVIYPVEIEKKAINVLGILEKNYSGNSAQLGKEPGKIPVVLHNHTIRSNGFVVWAPKRMEFFMYPEINSVPQDWYTHLSIHEFRHMVQLEKLNQGITKILTTVLGEQGIGPAVAMVPFWFIEGDAVYAETSLTHSGRGRSPEFEMTLKAHLLKDKKAWSFSKSYLGSYKNYVPDYYQYGYQMVSFGREEFGDDFWSGALDYTGRRFFLLNPFYFYMKKEAGISKRDFYFNTMSYLKNHWEKQQELRSPGIYSSFNNSERKLYTSYRRPQIMEDGSVIAVKSSLDKIDRFVRIDATGKESLVYIPGFLNSGRISYSKNRLIWDEFQPDLRWRNRSFSVLKEFNLETRTLRILALNTRYSSPSYSFSGDSIVAVETTLSNDFFLVFLSALDGGVFYRVPSPGNVQLVDPAWVDNSDKIMVIGLDDKGKNLLQYDRSEEQWKEILPSSRVNISQPVSAGNVILFNAGYDGIDNIYALQPGDGKLSRLTRAQFGAFQPAVSSARDQFAFSSYTENGYDIVLKPLEEIIYDFIRPDSITEQPFFRVGDSPGEKNNMNEIEKLPEIEMKKYNTALNLFHFHSWSPFYFDYNDPDIDHPSVSPGISLLSQNLLSTAVTTLGYEYKDQDHYFHTSFTYKGILPVIDISYRYGGLPRVVKFKDATEPERVSTASNFKFLTYIPLSFYSGRWITGFQPSLSLTYSNDYFYYVSDASYKKGIAYLEPRLYLYTYQRPALRDYYPRFGMILDYSAISSPFEDEQRGSNSAIKSTFFLPGIARGQGIRLKAEFQKQNPERYLFGNLLSFPRGYVDLISMEMNKYSVDYFIPLLYPDFGIEGLLYLKRVRANLFMDYLYGRNMRITDGENVSYQTGSYVSTGLELNFDYHLFRLLFPISSGIRASYLEKTGEFNYELLFNIYLDRF